MDLIYTDDKLVDQNVLQDYSFDEVYGIGNDANDFECKVQKYNHHCKPDDYLYIEFTEYGGIIDRIESDSKTGEITYKGRTWHGILNSHVIKPPTGCESRYYSGEINHILEMMIDDLGVSDLFVADAVPEEQRNIIVNNFPVRYEKGYDAIVRLLTSDDYNVNGKLIAYYYDKKVHIGAVQCVNYSTNDEFDTSQVPFKIGVTENTVNHLICLGQGEGANRAVIHLFTNDGSTVQPYTLIPEPLEDNEYILDERNKVMTGLKEVTEIYDAPNSEIITNYKPLNSEPKDWRTAYHTKYYEEVADENGEIKKRLIKKNKVDKYVLIEQDPHFLGKPSDWDVGTEYQKYYWWNPEKKAGRFKYDEASQKWIKCADDEIGGVMKYGAFDTVKALAESQVTPQWNDLGATPPPDWATNYSKYYIPNGTSTYTNVQARTYERYGANDTFDDRTVLEHTGTPLTAAPPNWTYGYTNYVTRNKNALNKWVYTGITGVPQQPKMEKVTRKNSNPPPNWKKEWSSYYVNVKKDTAIMKNKKIKKVSGHYITASDAVSQGKLQKVKNKDYVEYVKDRFFVAVPQPDACPAFNSFPNGVFEKYTIQAVPDWEYPTKHYYEKVINTTPPFEANKYYHKHENVEVIPDFVDGKYFYAVQDRYRKLVESGKAKLKELCDTSTLDISLELDSTYDVLDVIGAYDEVTKNSVSKAIQRKIVKIRKEIISIDYEVD